MENDVEIWKDIIGYEGLYQISNLGNVKSLRRNIILKPYLRGSRANNKYLCVDLYLNRKSNTQSIHRLVAEAFIANPNHLPEVHHKDENKLNNFVSNLEYCTQSENRLYSIKTGSIQYKKGSKAATSSLTYEEVQWIKENIIIGDTEFGARKLSKKFNVDKKVILNIYHDRTYQDVQCKYKLFFISDIHNGYDYMVQALNKAGFNENKYNHKLIVLGDWNDRLGQAVKTYEYLYRLTQINKAIVTSGNHHKFLIDFLEGSINPFNYIHNGLRETIADFWHRTSPFESWCLLDAKCDMTNENYAKWAKICRDDINHEYPELLPWLKSMPRYFESKNHIGVHGALDLKVPDWHYPHCYRHNLVDWDALDFDDGSFIFQNNTTNKTIVVGHFDTGHLRKMWQIDSKNYNDHSILFTKDKKVFIDGCTALTKKVNVYVIEDELLEYQEYEKETQKDIDNKTEGRKQ